MKRQKRSAVAWAMDYHRIVILITSVLIAFGVVGLVKVNKNEFPTITIRQGVVVAVYPGVSAAEIEEQLTKPLEQYVFTYKEVNKEKTKSYSRNSLSIVQVELNDDVKDKDEFWSKFKHGIETFRSTLPSGVLAVQVNDDFGDTSALLITMESADKTYRELNDYMNDLQDELRTIESVGRMTVSGMRREQISVVVDHARLAQYGISEKSIALALKSRDFTTTAGSLRNGDYSSPIYVAKSVNAVADVEQMVVYSDPRGAVVRLKDVVQVRREYPQPSNYVTNNGVKCLVLSVEMKQGRSITDMGNAIYERLDRFEQTLPQSVHLFRITDQAKVVANSVWDFLKELLIAIVAVIIVVVLLMPLRVALVAAATIPITIFISLGLFYAFDIELNTVTLAALIVTLGMIVDNSIVIIDSYMEKLGEMAVKEGNTERMWAKARRKASIEAATHFFPSILTATLAISITFFPFLITTRGSFNDVLQSFPWAISIVLFVSLFIAELVVPFLQYYYIKGVKVAGEPPALSEETPTADEDVRLPNAGEPPMLPGEGKKKDNGLLARLQRTYDRLIDGCFRHPKWVIAAAIASVVVGAVMLMKLPQRLMPNAERNQFAVEITLPTGTMLDRTVAVADSLERLLRRDDRVVSIASFKGMASPRFHTVYAPQFGGTNYAQFIVNTSSVKATEELLAEYKPRCESAFPEAYVRFKQLSYGAESNPIEMRLTGKDWPLLKATADSLLRRMRQMPALRLVRSDTNEPLIATRIALDDTQASRLGVSHAATELSMLMRYNTDGMPLATIWQGDYPLNICLKGNHADQATRETLANELVDAEGGLRQVPLRQVATVAPEWQDGQIAHRNGLRTITIMSEVEQGRNVTQTTGQLQKALADYRLPEGVTLSWGGEVAENESNMPTLLAALAIAAVIIFFLLVYHFRHIGIASLLLASLLLCLFGTAVGILAYGELTMTCFLGFISLMGILVRNAIIMYDYAREVSLGTENTEKTEDTEPPALRQEPAIVHAAKRRMRPIFLTSAAASMGVIPMILGGSSLWAPMGNVIFFGTIITMLLILTVLPVAYRYVD